MAEKADHEETEANLHLPASYEKIFLGLEQVKQEQVVFDAWRRSLQDWRHRHFHEWKLIDEQTVTGREVELNGWKPETLTAGIPEMTEIKLQYNTLLSNIDVEARHRFLKHVGEHIQDIIDNRYQNK